MTVKHLSEMEIQQYILEVSGCSLQIITHMQHCDHCKAMAADYEQLFEGIREQPVEAFDFDVCEMVLPQLAHASDLAFQEQANGSDLILQHPVDPSVWRPPLQRLQRGTVLSGIAAVVTGGAAIYYFRHYLASLFTGISSLLLYFILISVGTALCFLLADIYREYQRKMNILDHH